MPCWQRVEYGVHLIYNAYAGYVMCAKKSTMAMHGCLRHYYMPRQQKGARHEHDE